MIKRFFSLYLLSVFFLLLLLPGIAPCVTESGPAGQTSNLTSLEELVAVLHNNGGVVEVKGSIKNISNAILRGFVTIYLLDANGKVINARDEAVGGGVEFSPGMIAEFEVMMKVPRRARIETVSVDFVRD